MPWKLFLVERTGFCRRSLRRYASGSTCPLRGYHDAEAVIDPRIPEAQFPPSGDIPSQSDKADPRWPVGCLCGYAFGPDDQWQVNVDELYGVADREPCWTIRELPVGAMWNASWLAEDVETRHRYAGPDGKAWCVMMPNRVEWIVYGPSSNGQKWEVVGNPPDITVSPSIGINMNAGPQGYHGFIKAGILTEDCDGRLFEGVERTA